MNEDEMWDPSDHAGLRRRIENGTVEEWKRAFPAEYGNVRVELDDVWVHGKENYSLQEQKKAWMENRELGRALKANLSLYDKATNEKLDERRDLTLMKIPHYTDRGTFVYNGNNYTAASQARLMPGAFTRRQANGGLETQFNTRTGTGKVFRVGLDPETGQFRLKIAGSNLHLYSVLKDAGVSDEEMVERWGPELVESNRQKYDSRSLNKAFQKFVPRYRQAEAADDKDKIALLHDAWNKAQVSKHVINRTLASYWRPRTPEKTASGEILGMLRFFFPKKAAANPANFSAGFDIRSTLGDRDDEGDEYQPVGVEGLLAATDKLLAVNRGLDKPDDRSIPTFTKVYTMDKLMRERIRFDEGKLRRNILRMIASRRDLSPLHPRVFDPYYKEIITKNPLTTPIEETNPLQLLGQQRRITHMGPGGIGSSDAITAEMNAIQANEMGYYSVLEGPECFDSQTEVYTQRGWVAWPEVLDDDVFACRVDGSLEWHRAERIVRSFYEGPLYVGEHETVRMAVTPNHRVLYTEGRKYRIHRASDIYGKSIKLPIRHLPYTGDADFTHFSLPEIPSTHRSQRIFAPFEIGDWCAFVGWWLSEGNTHHTPPASLSWDQFRVCATQSREANPENYEEIRQLCLRMGICDCDNGKTFSSAARQLASYFTTHGPQGCHEKWIPEELHNAPIAARERMLDALLKGDGRYNAKRHCYTTVSKSLALSVERLAIGLGYTAFILVEKDDRERDKTTNYVVSIHRQKHRQLMGGSYIDKRSGKVYGGNWRVEDYKGYVYCATVPGGLLHVRGKNSNSGFWSGNSERAGVDVRLSWGARIGPDGRLRRRMLNRRSGAEEWVSPDQLYDKFVKLPD